MVNIELVSIRKGILTPWSENSVFGILIRYKSNVRETLCRKRSAVSNNVSVGNENNVRETVHRKRSVAAHSASSTSFEHQFVQAASGCAPSVEV